MQKKVFLFLFVVLSGNLFAESAFWGNLKGGPHAVGFQILQAYDYGRPFVRKLDYEGNPAQGERARPLQINIWYPAKSSNASSMQLADYIHLSAVEDFSELTADRKSQSETKFVKAPWFEGAPEQTLRDLLKMPVLAARDAQHAEGKFPLVLIANSSGLSSPSGHFILAEYLASQGYIVASVPARGLQTVTISSRESHVQMQDLQFTIGTLYNYPALDRDKLALIGFGMGGLGAALLAMHNTDIDAFVSLDTSLSNRFGYSLIFQSSLYKPNQLSAPLLHITAQEASEATDLAFFKAIKFAPVEYVRFKGLTSADFSSIGMVKSFLPPPKEGKAPERKLAYETICIYTLKFLDAHLQKNTDSRQFLQNKPEQNGIPADLVTVEMKPALKTPPTEQQFVQIVRTKGADRGLAIQKEFAALDPQIRIYDPDTLFELADEYVNSKKIEDAVAVLNICVEGFPDYWESYDRIGRIYMNNGNKQLAIEQLTKSLELNPDNQETAAALKKLRES